MDNYKKYLLLFNDSFDVEKLNEVKKVFISNGYIIKQIDLDNIIHDSIEVMLDKLKQLNLEDDSKVVVLSDSLRCLFAWYRIYNSIVNDFVFYVHNQMQICDFYELNLSKVYDRIVAFIGMSNEKLSKKIYINMDCESSYDMFSILIANNLHSYFQDFAHFFNEGTFSERTNIGEYTSKEYKYKGASIKVKTTESSEKTEKISLYGGPSEKSNELEAESVRQLFCSSKDLFMAYINSLYLKKGYIEYYDFWISVIFGFCEQDEDYRRQVIEAFNAELNTQKLNFVQKAHYNIFISYINKANLRFK
ncbi:MAG: hypothetical protein ACOZCL_16425 [Bacillota bacterium]